ncbi:hypothetical protein [Roseateles sp.]|uniref:hypothetical protein n=1 Tax=Roseateles sp. TaxID=1971397 RepID=UPI00326541F8
MVSAVGGIGSGASGTGSVGADSELAQLHKKLSECVNCESATTLEGRTQIAEISTRITAIKDRQHRVELTTAPPEATPASPTAKATDGTLGTQLDVYA